MSQQTLLGNSVGSLLGLLGGYLSGLTLTNRATVHLFQNNLVPQFNTGVADLTEADFVGYTKVLSALWGNGIDQEGNPELYWNDVPATFTAGAVIGPQIIYGYWVDTAADGIWIIERFDTPITISAPFQYIAIVPRYNITGVGGTGNIND